MNKQLRDRLKIPANPLKLSEAQIQRAVFAELRLREQQYPELRWVIHIPNEGKRSTIGGKLAKDGGLNPGVLDILPVLGGNWALELKAGDNQPTPAQSWWMHEFEGEMGAGKFGLAYTADEAIDFILYQYAWPMTQYPLAAWRATEWLTIFEERGYEFVDPRIADLDKSRAW